MNRPTDSAKQVSSPKAIDEDEGGGRLSDLAYRRILEALFEKRVPAGAFVSQNDLVRVTGVPVGPLRDALRVLEAEGLLTIHPRSGIQFVKPGLELTRSTYQFRGIMERAAVRVYAETADSAGMAELAKAHHDTIAIIKAEGHIEGLHERMEELEDQIHGSIIASLENPLVETSYKRVWNYLRLLRLDRKLTPPLALRSLTEHLQILDAARARDADRAEAALQAHFSSALQRSLGMF
jgi:DNA-binding GntR family transcriptional regulator